MEAGFTSAELSQGQGDGPRALDPTRQYLRVTLLAGSAFLSEMDEADHSDDDGDQALATSRGPVTRRRPAGTSCYFVAHLAFRGQRFRSLPVPAAVSPEFSEPFLLDLAPDSADSPPLRRHLDTTDGIELVVSRIAVTRAARRAPAAAAPPLAGKPGHGSLGAPSALIPFGGAPLSGAGFSVELLAACTVEWRRVLVDGSCSFTVELPATGAAGEAGLSAGALAMRCELVPGPRVQPVPPAREAEARVGSAGRGGLVRADAVEARVAATRSGRAGAARRLFVRARRWWDGLVQAQPRLKHRPVRVFAQGEAGTFRCVTAFVQPLRAGRLIESPAHAARFVSLLPLRGYHPLGGGRPTPAEAPGTASRLRLRATAASLPAAAEPEHPDTAAWHTPATTITLRSGSPADHATLLCSLLRGFGLDAFVAVGTWTDAAGVEDTHEWVVTMDEGGEPEGDAPATRQGGETPRVVFWEPLSGERYEPDWPTSDGRRFTSVACLFNEASLLANVQPASGVTACDWRVHEEALWSPLDAVAIADHSRFLPLPIALAPPTVASGPVACALEASLRHEVTAWRRQLGLSDPLFDAQLEHCLSPALAAYESERLTGRPFGTSEFRAAVRSCLPAGHAFSAFPFQVTHVSPAKIAEVLRASDIGRRVVSAGDHDAALAVRVRVYAYAEDVLAVWVIVASIAP